MNSPTYSLPDELLERILNRWAFDQPIQQLVGYRTQGGTYVVASAGYATDSGDPRDLVAILPGDLGKGRVLPLYIGTNPAMVTYLEAELARYACERAAHAAGWIGSDKGAYSSCNRCDHPASQWVMDVAECACDHAAEAESDKQTCSNCQDEVYTLSTRGWCDGCEAEAALQGAAP